MHRGDPASPEGFGGQEREKIAGADAHARARTDTDEDEGPLSDVNPIERSKGVKKVKTGREVFGAKIRNGTTNESDDVAYEAETVIWRGRAAEHIGC